MINYDIDCVLLADTDRARMNNPFLHFRSVRHVRPNAVTHTSEPLWSPRPAIRHATCFALRVGVLLTRRLCSLLRSFHFRLEAVGGKQDRL
jgi:hypothetical protein